QRWNRYHGHYVQFLFESWHRLLKNTRAHPSLKPQLKRKPNRFSNGTAILEGLNKTDSWIL
ncbi:hypothetical protein N9B68_02730, partial [bacterium]|nr:hypothetical protein [bacterium]